MKFINIHEESTSSKKINAKDVYTLMSNKKMSYLVYDATNDKVAEVESVVNVDESNLNHSWMMIEIEGRNYIYYIGARKYLQSTGSGFTLTSVATPIDTKDGEDGIFLGSNSEEWSFVKNAYLQADDSLTPVIGVTVDGKRTVAPVYDLSGRRLGSRPQKGVYIQGGKKVISD